MKTFLVFSVLLITLLSCTSKEPPLSSISRQHITKINVLGYLGPSYVEKRISLIDPYDIEFIVEHLSGLEPRRYDHSSPEFDLEFETKEGGRLLLRVSKYEIGPDAAASAYNTHWFPKDMTLYLFLKERMYGASNE